MQLLISTVHAIDSSAYHRPPYELSSPPIHFSTSHSHTISSHQNNLTSVHRQDVRNVLLNGFPPPASYTTSVQSQINSGAFPLNPRTYGLPTPISPAATLDSPATTNHVSPSLALSELRLRTPNNIAVSSASLKPLPTVLPPVPSLSSYTSSNSPVRKPSINTLRRNYTEMLSKKTSMPPPPPRVSPTVSGPMDFFGQVGAFAVPGEIRRPPLHPSVISVLRWLWRLGSVEAGEEACGGGSDVPCRCLRSTCPGRPGA